MKKYKHLFFDLDGTLWDLQENTRNALIILFDKYKTELSDADFEKFFKRYHYHNDQVWTLYRQGKIEKDILRSIRFKRAFEDVGLTVSDDFIEQFSQDFLEVCPRQPKTLEGAHELLDYCKQHYQLHIITNGFIEVQGHKMEAAKLTSYFNQIINSEHCGVRKPNAGIFEYALDKAGANKEDSLMIGDDWEADIIGARDFGINQAFITTTDDLMNDIHKEAGHAPLRHNYKPTYTISRLTELMEVL